MTRSITLYKRLFRPENPASLAVLGLIAARNDLLSAGRALLRSRKVAGRPWSTRRTSHGDWMWAFRMSVLHLYELGRLLGNRELMDSVAKCQTKRGRALHEQLVGLRRDISRHPILDLRSEIAAHYKLGPIAEAVRGLHEEGRELNFEAVDGKIAEEHYQVADALHAGAMLLAWKRRGSPGDYPSWLNAQAKSMLDISRPLDRLIAELVMELRSGRL